MLDALRAYAIKHQIPIITDEGLNLMKSLIKEHHIKHVLEIGTAMGYSALAMAYEGCFVDTIERDLVMLDLAKENLMKYDLDHRINLIEANALEYEGPLKSYDLIFIDAAKAQYQKFFDKYVPCLSNDGIIVCDNLNFHHLDIHKVNRNTRQLIQKLHRFKEFLTHHSDFETTFLEIGDGMSLTKRKKK